MMWFPARRVAPFEDRAPSRGGSAAERWVRVSAGYASVPRCAIARETLWRLHTLMHGRWGRETMTGTEAELSSESRGELCSSHSLLGKNRFFPVEGCITL